MQGLTKDRLRQCGGVSKKPSDISKNVRLSGDSSLSKSMIISPIFKLVG